MNRFLEVTTQETSDPEWPTWVQPQGTVGIYNKDAKAMHLGIRWISDVDNNTWEPGVFGWVEYEV